jgi:hypothetical protein
MNVASVTDEDLAKKQASVAKLRQQVEDADRLRITRERDQANDITYAQLDAEEARLQAQLDAAKAAAKVGSVKDAASAPLAAAQEDKAVAQAQGAAAVPTPTTGEGS